MKRKVRVLAESRVGVMWTALGLRKRVTYYLPMVDFHRAIGWVGGHAPPYLPHSLPNI